MATILRDVATEEPNIPGKLDTFEKGLVKCDSRGSSTTTDLTDGLDADNYLSDDCTEESERGTYIDDVDDSESGVDGSSDADGSNGEQEEFLHSVPGCSSPARRNKNGMLVDQFDYGKSKDGKAGNKLRAHNEVMVIRPSPIEGRPPSVAVLYPPYIAQQREQTDKDEVVPTRNLYFKIGPKVHEYNCVRNSWLRAGFVRTSSSSKFCGYWGRGCSAQMLRNLLRWQKVNHFPGSWVLGRKDRLGRLMGHMRRKHSSEYEIHAETLIMPIDRRKLGNLCSAEPRALWIIKPASSSCGRGIRVVSSNSINPKKLRKGTIVQRYLSRPYLIDGRKFDLRLYVIVTCFDPLRAYMCEEGLVRFATGKYSRNLKSLKNRFVHLTNYSVNKNSDDFEKPTGHMSTDCGVGSKWSLQALLKYFRSHSIDDKAVLRELQECCTKSLIAAEPHIASLTHQLGLNRTNCFEVFGFDVMLDQHLKAWLIEVNVSPSLSSSSPLDKRIKNKLLCDVFHMVGFTPFSDTREMQKKNADNLRRLHTRTAGARNRRDAPVNRKRNVLQLTAKTLDNLSPEDLEMLQEMEEEFSRRSQFTRIYPSSSTERNKYFSKFFEVKRYNNTLVNLWIEHRGVDSLITGGPYKPRSSRSSRHQRAQSRASNGARSPRGIGTRHASVDLRSREQAPLRRRSAPEIESAPSAIARPQRSFQEIQKPAPPDHSHANRERQAVFLGVRSHQQQTGILQNSNRVVHPQQLLGTEQGQYAANRGDGHLHPASRPNKDSSFGDYVFARQARRSNKIASRLHSGVATQHRWQPLRGGF